MKQLSQHDLIIDALLGTGIRGTVRTPFFEIIQAVNESNAKVLAVDVPSGLDCDLGTPCGVCVRADRTVTFVARKIGFLVSDAQEFIGEVEVCHIGIPQEWLTRWSQHLGEGLSVIRIRGKNAALQSGQSIEDSDVLRGL